MNSTALMFYALIAGLWLFFGYRMTASFMETGADTIQRSIGLRHNPTQMYIERDAGWRYKLVYLVCVLSGLLSFITFLVVMAISYRRTKRHYNNIANGGDERDQKRANFSAIHPDRTPKRW